MSLADRILDPRRTRVRAILGPTNTGKTHRAIQRMLGHRTGMIGLPLRLLAQEVYQRVVAERGADQVALVTGEQKIVPAGARYWVCTVEAMPIEKHVAFVAIDEVQLAGQRNRGHVFTDRILHARGVLETLMLGSDTIQPLLEQLVPDIEVERYPRLSRLEHFGSRKLLSLPPRTAVVDFTAERVYELAERLRARHGGVAVVLGALSPRARNAQVGLYQSGEVDHLVATDAIGMGLNMDVHRVVFADVSKFDGHSYRELNTAELAQIAGRAGRHRRDGKFGTLNGVGLLPAEVVEAIEQHRFPTLRRLYWRNADLDFRSLDDLLSSLEQPSPARCLVQVRDWLDHRCLRRLAAEDEVRSLARGRQAVARVWEVCSIPDYRKTRTDSHVQLLLQLCRHLLGPGQVPGDWVSARLDSLDRTDGDIDALMTRISWVRTWNYITSRPDWFVDAAPFAQRARALEDALSQAVHDKLTARFVESRRGHIQLTGLRYEGGERLRSEERTALRASVQEGLERLLACDDHELVLDGRTVLWEGQPIARLRGTEKLTAPRVQLLRNELMGASARTELRRRLEIWVRGMVHGLLAPLEEPERCTPAVRGLLFALRLGLGSARTRDVAPNLARMGRTDRRQLARIGVRVGRRRVYSQALLAPGAIRLRALLWRVHTGQEAETPEAEVVPVRGPAEFYDAVGYAVLGPRAVRVDRAEDLAAYLRGHRHPARLPDKRVLRLLGCEKRVALGVMRAMGFSVSAAASGPRR